MQPEKMTSLQSDALKEVMSMGTAHAINAIAQMIQKKLLISVPNVSFIPVKEVPAKVARDKGVEQVVVGLYFKILGDLSGNILLVFPIESIQRLLWMIFEKERRNELGSEVEAAELERSAIMEVGNILTNSYLNALAAITDYTLFPSIPFYAEDMLGSIMDYLLIEISKTSDTALFVETEFHGDDVVLTGDFLIFPDPESLQKILQKVGVK